MESTQESASIPERIRVIRGQRVLLDRDLAELYGVPTKSLNLAVKRNAIRFPDDFMFRLTPEEVQNLRFQNETSSWGGRRYLPSAFTEQGVAMLSSVLKSTQAALVNIAIMRAFVRLREVLTAHKGLAGQLKEIERRLLMNEAALGGHDRQIHDIFAAIRRLMAQPELPRRRTGFRSPEGTRNPRP